MDLFFFYIHLFFQYLIINLKLILNKMEKFKIIKDAKKFEKDAIKNENENKKDENLNIQINSSIKDNIINEEQQDTEGKEKDDDFNVNIKGKFKIGKKLFDEMTITRCAIVKLSILGYKIKKISEILQIKPSLAWKWSHFERFKGKGERKSKFTEEEKKFLCKQADGKISDLEGASSRKLKELFSEKFNKKISHTTINSILNNGLSTPLRIINTFLLTKEHEEKRINFAKYILENNIKSDKILFTDECRVVLFPKINKSTNVIRFNSEDRKMRWKPEIQQKRANEIPKFEQSIMIAGGICKYGLTNLVFCSGTQNNFSYKQFLLFMKKDIDKFQEDNKLEEEIIFQQDNAACHTSYESKAAIKILFDKNYLEWPPNSPDLSPIENVWAILKEKLAKRKIKNLDELRENILDVWIKFPTSLCEKLCKKFDEKIKLIQEYKGARINREMLMKTEKSNKNEDEKDAGDNNDWTSVKRDNKFRIVFNDKIVKTIRKKFIKQIKKQKIEKLDEYKKNNEKLEKYEKAPKGMTKNEYNKLIDKKKEIIVNHFDKLIKSVESMSNEEFILKYLNKEKDDNIKKLMSSTLNKNFTLKEVDTCITSNFEEITEEKNDGSEKEIDKDIEKLNKKLDTLMERNNLNKVKEYVNENVKVKNLFPYEQKKLRRDENEVKDINKINEIKHERKVLNILDNIKDLNQKIKKIHSKTNEKESEIKIEMASDDEEMEIDD